jgi:four helix bundle protein
MEQSEKAKQNEEFRNRTKAAALRVIRLYQRLPRTGEAEILGKQLLRSATSVAANYRAACRARSAAEFFAKISICVEEADEAQFWLDLLGDAGIVAEERLVELKQEYLHIVSVLAKARKTASN